MESHPRGRRTDWLVLAAIGLLVQGFWALRQQQPGYMDAYYYATNGQRLAAGEGFTEVIIWQYLDDPAGLPAPSHTYWMPLPSLLAAAGYLVRDDYRGAQLPFWLLAGLLPALAYAISMRLAGERWQAWAAGLLTAWGGYYAAYLSQPSTFAPYAWAGGLALFLLGLIGARALSGRLPGPTLWLGAGLAAGVAHLTRADGVLLLFVGLGLWLFVWRPRRIAAGAAAGAWRGPALLLAGYLLVMGGWLIRNWLVIGRPLSAAGGQSLFLTSYEDLFAYGRASTLETFLDSGLRSILRVRWFGLSSAVQTVVAVPGLIFLFPFMVVGGLAAWRDAARRAFLQPMAWYALGLFVAMSLVLPLPGARGSLFHSSVALWPWTTALAPLGVARAVEWVAARRAHWRPARAKRVFTALFVVLALGLTAAISQARSAAPNEGDLYRRAAALIPPEAVIMVGNPPAYYYHTGRPALSVPNESPETVLAAADRYGATYLLLDEDRPWPLDELYQGHIALPRLSLVERWAGARLYRIERP
jgi:hypothetical protein